LAWFVDLNGLLVHGMELDIVMRRFIFYKLRKASIVLVGIRMRGFICDSERAPVKNFDMSVCCFERQTP
jgi:hypothetical protein